LTDRRIELSPEKIAVPDGFIGPGYGVPTAEGVETIRLVAHTEGIFLDPTYTAKAMAGLIDEIRSGRIREGEIVVFLHSGGEEEREEHARSMCGALGHAVGSTELPARMERSVPSGHTGDRRCLMPRGSCDKQGSVGGNRAESHGLPSLDTLPAAEMRRWVASINPLQYAFSGRRMVDPGHKRAQRR
jgi:hypothetical protein